MIEDVSSIDFRYNIGEVGGGAVGEDDLGEPFELGERLTPAWVSSSLK